MRSVLKSGPVTETGQSVLDEKTESEQVASKPMPWISAGGMFCSARAWRTAVQMHCQMLEVDCSYRDVLVGPVGLVWFKLENAIKVGSYVVFLLWLPETDVLGC